MMSLLIGNSFQKTFGQSSTLDTFDQEQIEKFRDLGEKGYIENCLELGFGKSACEKIANTVKSQAESYQQN